MVGEGMEPLGTESEQAQAAWHAPDASQPTPPLAPPTEVSATPIESAAPAPEQPQEGAVEMNEQEKNKITFERAFDVYTRVIQNIHENLGSIENQYRTIDIPTPEIAKYVLQMFGKSEDPTTFRPGTKIANIAGRDIMFSGGRNLSTQYAITY